MLLDAQSFVERAHLTELMDEPSSYEEFRDCLRDLEQVNQTVLGYRPTLQWLEQFVGGADGTDKPLHIVDVGSGGGDMLRKIEAWARRRKFPVLLTGIDLNPHATRAAREFTGAENGIRWVNSDAFSYRPAQPIDVVLSSLFTHHLPDDEVVRFLRWMEQSSTRGWFINDLSRGRISYVLFKLLARVMHWHRFVQHDGPVSIRRSFVREDWQRYITAAGLAQLQIHIFPMRPGRLCVSRVKP